ncbi:MAG: FkbM family methyltransferase, partial [Pseudomonadota bacterium]
EGFGVKVLANTWKNKHRQLCGFTLYYDTVDALVRYYGDCAAIKGLIDAPIPVDGFPSDVHVRDFILSHLCSDKKFRMRDSTLEYLDDHALWTLINEILVDQEYYFETEECSPLIIDGGANFGMSSIYFKKLYPGAKIIAFEPVPSLYDIAKRNIENSKYSEDIRLINKGLSSTEGKAQFYRSQQYSMAGSLTSRRVAFGDKIDTFPVDTVRLSRFLDSDVDFLKLDIEGSEGDVLLEAGESLAAVKEMCVEWHLHKEDKVSSSLDAVLSMLSKLGFIYQIGKSGNFSKQSKYKPMQYVEKPGTLNFWARRR